MALNDQEELELLTLEREKSAPAGGVRQTAPAAPPRPLTNDNPNAIDEYLIQKLSVQPGIGTAPDIQGSMPGRFIQGLADIPVGALQLGMNAVGAGGAINQKIKEINARTEALRGPNAGFDWSRMAGNVLNPAAIGAVAKVPQAVGYLGKVIQGGKLGALFGATAPVTDGGENFWSEKALQTGTGTLVGSLIPAVAQPIIGMAKNAYRGFIEPRINPAATRGRVYLDAAGDKADEVISAMRGAAPKVPGSMPTAGEAALPAASAEFSALQRQAMDIAPTPYVARADAQNAARLASLRTVGQDEAALKAAETARSAAADPIYQAARAPSNIATPLAVKNQIDDLLKRNPGNRELVTELSNIRKGLLTDEGRIRTNAEQVSSVIDGLKAAKANVENKFIAGHLNTLQRELEKSIPGYEMANKTFRDMSKPINQMQVGQYLEKKLVPALSEDARQKSATYAGALQDAPGTIKRSTGAPRYDDLTKVLNPDQMAVVNGIRDDLAQGARFDVLSRKGMKAAPDIGEAAGKQKVTGMFSRTVTIANEIIGRLEGKVNKKIAAEIAAEMLNPAQTAETMAQAAAREARNKATASMVAKSMRGVTATSIGAAERK